MSKLKIQQIEEKEILPKLCKGIDVFRVKLTESNKVDNVSNLSDKSINQIKKDMAKDDVTYLYFSLEV